MDALLTLNELKKLRRSLDLRSLEEPLSSSGCESLGISHDGFSVSGRSKLLHGLNVFHRNLSPVFLCVGNIKHVLDKVHADECASGKRRSFMDQSSNYITIEMTFQLSIISSTCQRFLWRLIAALKIHFPQRRYAHEIR